MQAGVSISIQSCSLLNFPVYPVFIKWHLRSTIIIWQIYFLERKHAYRNLWQILWVPTDWLEGRPRWIWLHQTHVAVNRKASPVPRKDIFPGNVLWIKVCQGHEISRHLRYLPVPFISLDFRGSWFYCSWMCSSWERWVGLEVLVLRTKLLTLIVPLESSGRVAQRNETIMNRAIRGPSYEIYPIPRPPQGLPLYRVLGLLRSGLQKVSGFGLRCDAPLEFQATGFTFMSCQACGMGKGRKNCQPWFVTNFFCDSGPFLWFHWPPFPLLWNKSSD